MHPRSNTALAVTTLMVFQLHLSTLLPCESWAVRYSQPLQHEAVLTKQQPGDFRRNTHCVIVKVITHYNYFWKL